MFRGWRQIFEAIAVQADDGRAGASVAGIGNANHVLSFAAVAVFRTEEQRGTNTHLFKDIRYVLDPAVDTGGMGKNAEPCTAQASCEGVQARKSVKSNGEKGGPYRGEWRPSRDEHGACNVGVTNSKPKVHKPIAAGRQTRYQRDDELTQALLASRRQAACRGTHGTFYVPS